MSGGLTTLSRMGIRIPDLPENDRPRERLERVGLMGLSDAELLALVIRTGAKGRSALTLAAELLAQFRSLADLAKAYPEELRHASAIGNAKAAALVAAFELGRRAEISSQPPRRISAPKDIIQAVLPLISDHHREEVFVLVLNAAHRLLRVERFAQGAADRASIPARDVITAVLRHKGIALAMAHTHPSGDPLPSAEDVSVTRDVVSAAKATGVRFIDHIVIAGERWASVQPDISPSWCPRNLRSSDTNESA